MEFFVVLICCAIAAALGFFIGAVMRTSSMVTLSIENRKLRERIKSEDDKGVDIYKSIVADPLKVTKDQREVGKLRELSLGYGGTLREPIKSEVQERTIRNGTTIYTLRDGTKIAFDGWDSVVTIDRGDKDDEVSEVQEATGRNDTRYVLRRSHSTGQIQSIERDEL